MITYEAAMGSSVLTVLISRDEQKAKGIILISLITSALLIQSFAVHVHGDHILCIENICRLV